MNVVLRGQELWKFVDDCSTSLNIAISGEISLSVRGDDNLVTSEGTEISKLDVQKRDLALNYITSSVDQIFKPLNSQPRRSKSAWKTLRKLLHAMSEAPVNTKISHL